MATKPTSDPTERSMFRETMTSTIPVGDDRDARRLDGQRDHVRRADHLPAAHDVEDEKNHRKCDEHPEQPEIDFGLGHKAQTEMRRVGRCL